MHPDAKIGIRLMTQHAFYEAHEYFENAWRETKDDSREFYRAILQLSGGFYRLVQKRPQAAEKFFKRSLYWLQGFPSAYLGINTDNLRNLLINLLNSIKTNQTDIIDSFFPDIKDLFEENLR